MRKVCSAADFVWCNTPLDILGSVTSITFQDPSCSDIKDHALTTEEVPFVFSVSFSPFSRVAYFTALSIFPCQVKSLCDDLGVLGKPEFKNLLK